jgi:PAS domain S-box-containing protein
VKDPGKTEEKGLAEFQFQASKTQHTRKERGIQESSRYGESIIETVREPLLVLNSGLRVIKANRSFYDSFKVTPEETIGSFIYDLGNRQWDIPKLRTLLEDILPKDSKFDNYQVEHEFATVGRRVMLLNARQIQGVLGKERIILLAIEDVTERRQAEEVLQLAHDELGQRAKELTKELRQANEELQADVIRRKAVERELRESEDRYRRITQGLTDYLYTVRVQDGQVVETQHSAGCEMLTGYTAKEFAADPDLWTRMVLPERLDQITEWRRKILAGEKTPPIEHRIVRKDGQISWVSETAIPQLDPEMRFVAYDGVIKDITERKLMEEKSKRQYDRLTALRAIDMAITASLDIRVTFSVFLEQVINNLYVDAADVLLLNLQNHNSLSFVAGRGFRTNALRHTNLLVGTGYAGRVVQERKALHIQNLREQGQDFLKKSPQLIDEDFVTYYGVPLVAKGRVEGVLEIFNRTPIEPDQDWLDFSEALAMQAALAIDNAMLFDDLQKTNVDLIQAYDRTLEGWSNALDLRDKETEGHSRRVTEMTSLLGRKMDMRDSELMHMRRGALLHDIGKMGIPDTILLKPGTLNDAEREIMRKHPAYAYELLYPISYLRLALDIPYCHHERWDGTGYPRGLKGEYIPLAARIFAVIDVSDALQSDRPYRARWPEDKTREYIKEQSGTQFDPKVVEIFLELLNEQ